MTRIYVKLTVETDKPSEVIDSLKDKNFYRIDQIGVYIKHLIKSSNVDPEDFTITHRLLRIGNTAGFTISIK